jgi:phosphoglycerate kinase
MEKGEILFLENVRFYKGEVKDDKSFAKKLAKLGDVYVNNAFSVSHRKHASLSAIKGYLPSYAGILLEEELDHLQKVLDPKKPMVLIMGGAKTPTKIKLIKKLEPKADKIMLGGVVANDFLAAYGLEVGRSMSDKESIKAAKRILSPRTIRNARTKRKILLPVDVVVSTKGSKKDMAKVKNVNDIARQDIIYDIGPDTVKFYSQFIKEANTIVWNGPLGKFEDNKFSSGSICIAEVMAARSRGPAFGLAGGGESVNVLHRADAANNIDWVSTGGGAMLTYLSGGNMPGLKGLFTKHIRAV